MSEAAAVTDTPRSGAPPGKEAASASSMSPDAGGGDEVASPQEMRRFCF